MRVYRIENAEGHGPWCFSPSDKDCGADRYDRTKDDDKPSCYEGPTGWDDCRIMRADVPDCAGPVLVHGCVNLTQLEQWFQCPNGRAVMEAHGHHGVVYEVEKADVYFGSRQVIFPLAKAERVGSFDLVTLTEMEHA
jgi:hypothetical protein